MGVCNLRPDRVTALELQIRSDPSQTLCQLKGILMLIGTTHTSAFTPRATATG